MSSISWVQWPIGIQYRTLTKRGRGLDALIGPLQAT